MTTTKDCLFCKIIKGEIPSKKLGENEHVVAISDISPQAPLHALILPRKHITSLNGLGTQDRNELLPRLYEFADTLVQDKGLRDRGYRTVINTGAEGGQTVFHLHMHVLGGGPLRGEFGV